MDVVGQLDVFRHYGYMLSMYSTQVSIFQEAREVTFDDLPQSLDHMHLEVQIMQSVCLCCLTAQVHKGLLVDEEPNTLLVLVYLMESHHPQLVPLGPLQPPFMKLCGGPAP